MSARMIGTRRVTGLAGIGAAILFGGGSALWGLDQPGAAASAHDVVAFYTNTSARIIAGAILSLFAIPLLIVFASGVRAILREHEGEDVLATTAFGGGLLLCASGLAAETINMIAAQRAGEGRLTAGLGQALFEVSYALGYDAAGVGVGILVLAAAAVALRSRTLLPRRVALPMLILGCAFVTPLSQLLLAPMVLLLAFAAARLLRTPTPRAESPTA